MNRQGFKNKSKLSVTMAETMPLLFLEKPIKEFLDRFLQIRSPPKFSHGSPKNVQQTSNPTTKKC